MKLRNIIRSKKGQVMDNLSALFIGLAGLAIVAVVIFLIFSNLASNTQVAADSNASAAVVAVQNAGDDIVDWLPIVVITIIGALLIGLVAFFRGRR